MLPTPGLGTNASPEATAEAGVGGQRPGKELRSEARCGVEAARGAGSAEEV